MKLSLNWLNDFVDLSGIEPKVIADRLTMTTAEVEEIEYKGRNDYNAVIATILSVEPLTKKLVKLSVDKGNEVVTVVCGAPNCRVGMRVALANIGIKEIAGVESHGMCLSGKELGISSESDGILDLQTNLSNGTSINKVIPDLVDVIFDIDNRGMTNRPDLWGHYGFARELSVIFNRKLKPLTLSKFDETLPAVPVRIETQDCYSFGAFRAENITRKVSPEQIKARLFYCGINSHGFLVDLSNYIMLEIGQPNHAFDGERVKHLSAGHVNNGTFTTLKDQTIEVKPNYIFIKSGDTPVSLAGIMGGANSLVCENTTSVTWEWATFNSISIRKTSSELGIRSDSSTRYEKSLDTNLNKHGAERAIYLLKKYDKKAKITSNFNWIINKPTQIKAIKLNKEYLESFCGTQFNYIDVKRNLKGLGFSPVITKNEITVTVPTWRATKDINLPVDIIEEIARTHGFENIVPTPPRIELKPVDRLPHLKRIDELKDILSKKYACNEVHTYIWNDTKIEQKSFIKILNSVQQGLDDIRSELIPSLVRVMQKNKPDSRVFEIGRVFKSYPDDPEPTERTQLGISISCYQELAHILSDVFSTIGLKLTYEFGKPAPAYLHPKNNALVKVDNRTIGRIGVIHPSIASNIAAAAICLDTVGKLSTGKSVAKKPSKFPKTTLDFTITTKSIYRDLESVFDKFTHPLLMEYSLKDVYNRGGELSYTLQFIAGSYEKTLTTEDIQEFWQKVVEHGKKNGYTIDNT